MRAFRLLVIAALTGGALFALAPIAHAASSTQACDTLQTLSDDLGNIDTPKNPNDFDDIKDAYDDLGAAYKKAARTAPKPVRSALRTIGAVYTSIGDGDMSSLQDLGSKKYSKALRKYTNYMVTSCSAS